MTVLSSPSVRPRGRDTNQSPTQRSPISLPVPCSRPFPLPRSSPGRKCFTFSRALGFITREGIKENTTAEYSLATLSSYSSSQWLLICPSTPSPYPAHGALPRHGNSIRVRPFYIHKAFKLCRKDNKKLLH